MIKPATKTPLSHYFVGIVVLVLQILQFGCQPSEPLPVEVQKQLASLNPDSASDLVAGNTDPKSISPVEKVSELYEVGEDLWIHRDQLPWSYSEVQYVGNTRTGYSTISVDRSELSELKQLRIRREDVIDRNMDGSEIPQRKVILEIFEKPTGEMSGFRFDSKINGENDLMVEGRVVFNDLEITKRERKDQPIRLSIPWIRKNWGPFGIQAILMRKPMKPSEVRNAQVFIPQLTRYVPVLFEAQGMELTPLAQGRSQELLKIDLTIGTAESGVLTSLFVDPLGIIQKTITRSGQTMLSMQVPLETVQRIADQSEFSRGIARRVAVTGDMSSLPRMPNTRFIIQAEDSDPYDIILRNQRQQLKSINPDRCELTIKLDSSTVVQADGQAPDLSTLESSLLIPVEKEVTTALAAELLSGHSRGSPAEKAEVIRATLHDIWKLKPIAAEIVSTLVSARDRSGSCIEASHLLTALLRHEKIPAQLVCGLKIEPATSEAQFHVWNQAWLNDRWVDLDSTIPGQIGNLHIAMSTFTGSGQNPYAHYLTILNALAKLRSLHISDAAGQ